VNCLETPKTHGLHSVAGNGKRDGLRSAVDWAISSQAADGAAMFCGRSVEGSTTRTMSANDNSSHECAAPMIGEDIVSSLWETERAWIKSRADKTAEGRCALISPREIEEMCGKSSFGIDDGPEGGLWKHVE